MTNMERTRFTFRIPVQIFEKVKSEAEKKGMTLNSLMMVILCQYFESKELGYSSEGRN